MYEQNIHLSFRINKCDVLFSTNKIRGYMSILSNHTIQGVIFDFDGVIIDSEPWWCLAKLRVFNSAGLNVSREDAVHSTGKRVEEIIAENQQLFKYDNNTAKKLVADIYAVAQEEISKHAQPIKGLYDAIELLLANNITLAIATSSPANIIISTLEKLQLRDAFKIIHSAEKEQYGKPHPAVYLTARAMLGIDTKRCFAIEDSFNGLIAAKAAKLPCVLIDEQKNSNFGCIANKVIADLTGVNQELLQELS